MRTAFVIAATLLVSACASGVSPDGPSAHYAALSEACSQRGGVLTQPMDRRLTGKAGTGYLCRINGGATRIPVPATTAG